MTDLVFRYIVFLMLSIGLPSDLLSQPGNIFFSVTGDTVCYSDYFVPNGFGGIIARIKQKVKVDSVKTLSHFSLNCHAVGCLETLNKDTVKKYNFQFDGIRLDPWNNPDFVISVESSNTRVMEVRTSGPRYIYLSTVAVDIRCNEQKLYSKVFDIYFKGDSEKEVPVRDMIRIQAWQKKSSKKYFIDLNVKEKYTLMKPGDIVEGYFKGYQYIL